MSAVSHSPIAIPYRDPKRYGWLLSIIVPMAIWAGPLLYFGTHRPGWLWTPVVFFYVVVPLLDIVFGSDPSNPPESAVAALEADKYYRMVAWIMVPFLWATFIAVLWFVTTQRLPWWAIIPVIMGAGSAGGFCINVGHELGHKHERIERILTKIVLAPSCYGHFTVDHNRGHHDEVATPEDPASARMGESIYAFACRELPGAWARSWRLEKERLARHGRSAWSVHNEVLQPLVITMGLWTSLIVWLGWRVVPFLLLSSFWANFQLTSANYIEHYGLLRRKLPNGRREACEPRHSWNSDHRFSNYALLHLQRHSDHHAWPSRPYQTLRHFADLPQLPNGYFGMFVLSYSPLLWFRVMDPLLVKSVGGDPERINFQPSKRDKLMRKYRLKAAA
jgi:alkane 1-monooxygenase